MFRVPRQYPLALLPLMAAHFALGGCASVPASQERARPEVFRYAPARTTTSLAQEGRRAGTANGAWPPAALQAVLSGFSAEQRAARLRARPGGAMSDDSRESWAEILRVTDGFLRERPEETLPLDVIRARVGLEAELEMAAVRYSELPPGLAASVRARVMALDRFLQTVRTLRASRTTPVGPLVWPIEPPVVTSLYGMRLDPFAGGYRLHEGVDLKADVGQRVGAAGPGVVVRAERTGGHGLTVEVAHDDGASTRYSHLSLILVQTGMRVPQGGPLGLSGNTGRSTGPHLHFELWRDGRSVDPLDEIADPEIASSGSRSASR
jgi:hypothetical protein